MTERRAFSVSTFVRNRGRVLLIRHARLKTWLPVGGEMEAGETPLEAARRELREETGLEGRFELLLGVDGAPPGLLGYEEHQAGSKGLHMNFVFVADADSTEVPSHVEFTEHRWVTDTEGLDCPQNVKQLVSMAMRAGAPGPREIAESWLEAFNGRQLQRLLDLYDDDAVHTSPKLRAREPRTEGRIRGKAALRDWFADAFERLPELRYVKRFVTADADRVLLEYDRISPGDPTMVVAEVFGIRSGRIAESHVFHG